MAGKGVKKRELEKGVMRWPLNGRRGPVTSCQLFRLKRPMSLFLSYGPCFNEDCLLD